MNIIYIDNQNDEVMSEIPYITFTSNTKPTSTTSSNTYDNYYKEVQRLVSKPISNSINNKERYKRLESLIEFSNKFNLKYPLIEKIKKGYFKCECGSIISEINQNKHYKTRKHLNLHKQIIFTSVPVINKLNEY